MMDRLEFKANLSVDDAGAIAGLAWPFGSPDRVGDEILPGSFKAARPPLPILFAHDPTDPLGAWDSISETKAGLEVKGRLLVEDVPRAKEIRALVKSGAVTGMSIGFMTKSAKAKAGGGRTISAVELFEISLVTVPSHPGARIRSAKSAMLAIALATAINNAALTLRPQ